MEETDIATGLTFMLDTDNKATIRGVSVVPNDGILNIPKTVKDTNGDDHDVASFGANAFTNRTEIKGVTFPVDSVLTAIGNYAFYGCPITTIAFPASLKTIGDGAFQSCLLTSVTFPTDSVLELIGETAFSGCPITTIAFPANLKTIKLSAFSLCRITSVTFPTNSVLATIGNSAFYDCPLNTIEFPVSLESIGVGAFRKCPLIIVTFSADSGLKSIGNYAFADCAKLSMVTLMAKSLKEIGQGAFSGLPKLNVVSFRGYPQGASYDATAFEQSGPNVGERPTKGVPTFTTTNIASWNASHFNNQTLVPYKYGTITNIDTINNIGTINNTGDIINNDGGKITNENTINNAKGAAITNTTGATLENKGSINNTGSGNVFDCGGVLINVSDAKPCAERPYE